MDKLVNNKYNEIFMQRAIELSQIAYKSGKGLPIGCVIVKDNVIIGEGHNEIFSRTNPTSHAEMVAIENTCNNLGSLTLNDCAIYTSLEPCPMCLAAIYWAKYGNAKQLHRCRKFDTLLPKNHYQQQCLV